MKDNHNVPNRLAFHVHFPMNAKPKRPSEVPVPERNPEINPAEDPEPTTWPKRNPEIQPEKEPLTVPPTAPPEIPKPPESVVSVPT